MTARTTVLLVTALASLGAFGFASRQPATPGDKQDKMPSQPAPPVSPAEKAVGQVAFLTGVWSGPESTTSDFHVVEETWTASDRGAKMGMMRWIDESGVKICEFMTITAEPDAVRLRIRHFDGALNPKIETDKPSTLKLDKATPNSATFTAEKDSGNLARVTYTRAEYDLTIDVEFKDATRKPLKFKLHHGDIRTLQK